MRRTGRARCPGQGKARGRPAVVSPAARPLLVAAAVRRVPRQRAGHRRRGGMRRVSGVRGTGRGRHRAHSATRRRAPPVPGTGRPALAAAPPPRPGGSQRELAAEIGCSIRAARTALAKAQIVSRPHPRGVGASMPEPRRARPYGHACPERTPGARTDRYGAGVRRAFGAPGAGRGRHPAGGGQPHTWAIPPARRPGVVAAALRQAGGQRRGHRHRVVLRPEDGASRAAGGGHPTAASPADAP